MMNIVIAGLIGVFVGWNFPQPPWAVGMQTWLVAKWNSVFGEK